MTQGAEQRFAPIAPSEVRVQRALLSVSDKTGIVEFARGLADLGIEIISTGGTAQELSEAGIPVRGISDLTGFPEIMDGRVKTLHPKLYAGVLALRDDGRHMRSAQEHDVEFVDLICVNLYPFERAANARGVPEADVIENIDIGGPTMIRAAAKNAQFVAPVVSPESYDAVLEELREQDLQLSSATREYLAAEAFAYTARYDTAIARWFQEKREDFPPLMVRAFERVLELPYGENPHQRAAYYAQVGARTHVLSMVGQLGGKPLSYNNLLDLDAGRLLLAEFQIPACVIIKHNNPCGVAVGKGALEAYQRAFACDPMSAFGGVICLNRKVDRELAEALSEQFIEVLFARGYDEDALDVLSDKPNVRLLDDRERRTPDMIEPPCARSWAACSCRTAMPTSRTVRRWRSYRPGGLQRGRMERVAVRLEGLQARPLQRDRPHSRSRDGRDRRRADEPRRLGPARDREGALGSARNRAGVRRLLPVLRRAADRARRRHHRCDPARRIGPRHRRWSRRSTRSAPRWCSRAAGTSGIELRPRDHSAAG